MGGEGGAGSPMGAAGLGPCVRRVVEGSPGPHECSFNLEAEQDSRLWGKDKFHL